MCCRSALPGRTLLPQRTGPALSFSEPVTFYHKCCGNFFVFSFRLVISLLALVPASPLFLLEGREAFSHHFDLNCVCVSRRYVTGHIWACPPSEGDDYIFHCHPPDQKIPKPKRLQEWYKKMLDKAFAERIIHDYKVPGAETGRGGGMACLPLVLTHVRTAFTYEE